ALQPLCSLLGFELINQLIHAVEVNPRFDPKSVRPHHKFPRSLSRFLAKTSTQGLIDRRLETLTRSTHFLLDALGDITIECQRGPHIGIMMSQVPDVKMLIREIPAPRRTGGQGQALPLQACQRKAHSNGQALPARLRAGISHVPTQSRKNHSIPLRREMS